MRPARQPDHISRPIEDWDELITHLRQWTEQHGTSRVPQAATVEIDDGSRWPLGLRVKVIRQRYSRGSLDPWYVRQLEQLPGWHWTVRRRHDPTAPSYHEMPQEWLDRHSHVLQKIQTGKDLQPTDRNWLWQQRDAARKGRLTPGQTKLLEQLNAAGDRAGVAQPYGPARTAAFARTITRWMDEHDIDDINQVPFRTTIGDVRVGPRIAYYRARHSIREGRKPLSQEEIQALEQIPGWTWTPRRGPYSETGPPASQAG